jgi:hypothetical protein
MVSLFFSLSIMNFEAPVLAEEGELAMDDSVKRALDAAKLGRSESAARMGQVFLVATCLQSCSVFLPLLVGSGSRCIRKNGISSPAGSMRMKLCRK